MDNIWGLIGMVAVGYVLWKYFSKNDKRPRLGILQGGRVADSQFRAVQGPEPQLQGGTPPIAVVGWPMTEDCKC